LSALCSSYTATTALYPLSLHDALPISELQRRLASGDFEVAQTGWSGRADPSGNIEPFVTCGAPLNDSGYCNAHLDRLLRQARAQDRKSTRLNSSHVKISYAVFCLKKKK